jgi:capsular exopolysaccharide synthesis family protein
LEFFTRKMDNNLENGISNPSLPQSDSLPQDTLLQIAFRNRWIILSNTILFLVAGLLYLSKATPIYTSTSRLYVEQTGPKIINEYEGVMTQSKNYLYTQAELIKSSPIVADVVDNTPVKQFRTFGSVDNLVMFLKRGLDISIGRKDDIISVSFNSPYPEEAAQIVNAVVDSYVRYQSTRKRNTVSEVLRIIQKEKVKRDNELSGKFAEMLEFTRKNGVVSFTNNGSNVVFERLTKLSEALTEAQLAATNAKADFEAVKSMTNEPAKIKQFAAASPTGGVRIFVNDVETQLQSELREAEVELKSARLHCTEDHPSVQAIHSKINQLKQQLDEQARQFADAYTEVMQLRWVTAKQREDELQTSFDTQRQATQDLGIKAAEYSVIQSELKRLERLCEILDDRIKELNVTEDVGALNISILEVAHPAGTPSKPEKTKIMAMALVLGILFGCGLALLRDWLDYRLRSADEISAILGVPVLGVVPTMSEGQTIVTHGQKVWLKLKFSAVKAYRQIRHAVLSPIPKGEANAEEQTIMARAAAYRSMRTNVFCGARGTKAKVMAARPPSYGDSHIIPVSEKQDIVARGQKVHLASKSIVAEAYRTIRTAVFFGSPKGEAKTILVTSPAPGDGKSTLVSNLAITMAQAGQRTLILDGDFRRPVQHKIFEIDEKKGLSSVLAGKITMEEAVQPGPVKGLDILARGPEVPNPSELLNSDAFADILKNFSERYDRVIIDSPPVVAVADSQILGALCNVTVLVLRAEKSTRRLSQQARDALLSVGAHILGVVVNDVSPKRGYYGYYSGYGRYSRYGGYGYYGYYSYHGEKEKKTG